MYAKPPSSAPCPLSVSMTNALKSLSRYYLHLPPVYHIKKKKAASYKDTSKAQDYRKMYAQHPIDSLIPETLRSGAPEATGQHSPLRPTDPPRYDPKTAPATTARV